MVMRTVLLLMSAAPSSEAASAGGAMRAPWRPSRAQRADEVARDRPRRPRGRPGSPAPRRRPSWPCRCLRCRPLAQPTSAASAAGERFGPRRQPAESDAGLAAGSAVVGLDVDARRRSPAGRRSAATTSDRHCRRSSAARGQRQATPGARRPRARSRAALPMNVVRAGSAALRRRSWTRGSSSCPGPSADDRHAGGDVVPAEAAADRAAIADLAVADMGGGVVERRVGGAEALSAASST